MDDFACWLQIIEWKPEKMNMLLEALLRDK